MAAKITPISTPAQEQEQSRALAVDQHPRQVELVAVQAQRLGRHVGVAAQAHAVEHARLGRVEVEGQVDGVDPVDWSSDVWLFRSP